MGHPKDDAVEAGAPSARNRPAWRRILCAIFGLLCRPRRAQDEPQGDGRRPAAVALPVPVD